MVSYFGNYSTRNDLPLVMVIILSTILNTAYFIPFVYKLFKSHKNELSNVEKLPKSMIISIAFCALFSIYLFFNPEIILNIIRLTGIVYEKFRLVIRKKYY